MGFTVGLDSCGKLLASTDIEECYPVDSSQQVVMVIKAPSGRLLNVFQRLEARANQDGSVRLVPVPVSEKVTGAIRNFMERERNMSGGVPELLSSGGQERAGVYG